MISIYKTVIHCSDPCHIIPERELDTNPKIPMNIYQSSSSSSRPCICDSRCFNCSLARLRGYYTISARLAAKFGREPAVACFTGGAAGAGGLATEVRVGLVVGAGGGAFLPVAAFAIGGFGALGIPPAVSDDRTLPLPFATGGFGADGTAATVGLFIVGFGLGGDRRVAGLGCGRRAGAGGGAAGLGAGAGISSLR